MDEIQAKMAKPKVLNFVIRKVNLTAKCVQIVLDFLLIQNNPLVNFPVLSHQTRRPHCTIMRARTHNIHKQYIRPVQISPFLNCCTLLLGFPWFCT